MQNETYEARSARLVERLRNVSPEALPMFLERERGELVESERPFADYMRRKLREKGLLQQDIFLTADLSENYGYKLVAEEKHTRQRDTILRLCLAARFRLEEMQEALIRCGMAPLHGQFVRDAALIVAIEHEIYDLQEINRLLGRCGQAPLVRDYE